MANVQVTHILITALAGFTSSILGQHKGKYTVQYSGLKLSLKKNVFKNSFLMTPVSIKLTILNITLKVYFFTNLCNFYQGLVCVIMISVGQKLVTKIEKTLCYRIKCKNTIIIMTVCGLV